MLEPDFVSGAIHFIDTWDQNDRIVITVNFGDQTILAIVDTGAPYCVLAPDVADNIEIDRSAGYRPNRPLVTRRGSYDGWLCRVPVTIEAELGTGIEFETVVFVPDGIWPPDLNFIGLANFLFRVPFAVDPRENLFYFGKPI